MRKTAASVTDFACRTFGRRNVVRAARFVLYRARRDVPNDLCANGEASLQRWILNLVPNGQRIHVIDVGANVGHWSTSMLVAAQEAGRRTDLDLHAFEPSRWTFERLTLALTGQDVRLRGMAVGDRSSSALLHVIAPGAGTNSLHPQPGASDVMTEEVATTTLDSYAGQAGLDHITLVKIDTEGHDLAVVRGAMELFTEQRISVAQFEYNRRWIDARSFLRDVFDLLAPYGYRIGKLTPNGVEFYPAWDAELETFVEGNYVACQPAAAEQLPALTWWKSTS